MKSNSSHQRNIQAGFTLVEIMVGLTIGMLAAIVIMQVFSVFESQKRSTTGSADAQTNGSIALYSISREMQQAGYPLISAGVAGVADSAIECATLTIDGVVDASTPNRLTPVVITDGTSDSITVRYGSSAQGGIPTTITALAAPTLNLSSNFGCQVGDRTLIVNGTSCGMSSAGALSALPTTPPTITLTNTATAAAGASLSCLGTWNEVTYAVNNGNLERNGVPIVVGVVNLQAQYGISAAANSNLITQWVDATAATGWNAPTVAMRNQIKAIRVAVVARNVTLDPNVVSSQCSSILLPSPTGVCAWEGSAVSPAPTVNLTADTNWQHYRYRVFETIIPLRNVIWSKSTL